MPKLKKKVEKPVEKPVEKKTQKKVTKPKEVSSSDLFEQINEKINEFLANALKYKDKEVHAAAARARKNSSELTALFKEYRRVTIAEKQK